MESTSKTSFLVRLTLILVSIISLGYLLYIGQFIIAPLFLAFMLAILFQPFAAFLERKLHFPKLLSSFSSILLILIVIAGIGFLFESQISNFGDDLPHFEEQFGTIFDNLQQQVSKTFKIDIDQQVKYLNKGLSKLLSSSGSILSSTASVFSGIFGFFFFTVVFLLFILAYRRSFTEFATQVFSEKHHSRVKRVIYHIKKAIKSYLIGICIQILIVSVLSLVTLSIFGVKYAVLIGIFTGLINIIPYVGIVISLLVACLFAFATVSPITALYVAIGYLVIHTIDGNVIIPFIVGSQVKINPLFTFLGIFIGASLWGVVGMFLCIPALAIFKIIAEEVDELKPWGKLLGDETSS